MTVNMDGTAIMQMIATIFIASCGGYEITFQALLVVGILALVGWNTGCTRCRSCHSVYDSLWYGLWK